ncbi:nuclease domain-containing protein [Cystobacter fuscus]
MRDLEFQDAQGNRLDLIQDNVVRLEEATTYRIALQLGDAARTGWRGWLGELELEWKPALTSFELRTSFWVGSQSLRVQGPRGETRLAVEVIPRTTKLESEAWAHLLRDLNTWMPGSTVGQEGGRHGAVGHTGCDIAGVASVLGELVPAFVSALEALLRTPREGSSEHWTEIPVHAVKQANRSTLRWLVNHPEVYQSVLGYTEERHEGRGALVPNREWRGSMDHAANRYVAGLVRQVILKLRDTAAVVLKALQKKKSLDPNMQRWCEERARWLLAGSEALDVLLRRSSLGALPREHESNAAGNTLVDDPVYARVHVLARLFLEPRFQLVQEDALLDAPVRPSYELYELWTFMALQRLLAEQLPHATWRSDGIDKLRLFDENPNGASYTAHCPGRGTLTLYFNLPFPGFLTKQREKTGRWSISKAGRPDLVVTWTPDSGPGQWICLDAKYRTDKQAVEESFESVHLYHDSLRWPALGDRGGRCAGAVLLVPSMNPTTAPWFEQDFLDAHGVGVFQLTPGQILHQTGGVDPPTTRIQ